MQITTLVMGRVTKILEVYDQDANQRYLGVQTTGFTLAFRSSALPIHPKAFESSMAGPMLFIEDRERRF